MTITLPEAVTVTRFGIDTTAACGDDDGAGTRDPDRDLATSAGGCTPRGRTILPFIEDHTVFDAHRSRAPASALRIRVTWWQNTWGFFDLSEFTVYRTTAGSATETTTPRRRRPRPDPDGDAEPQPTAAPAPVPTVTPTDPTPKATLGWTPPGSAR